MDERGHSSSQRAAGGARREGAPSLQPAGVQTAGPGGGVGVGRGRGRGRGGGPSPRDPHARAPRPAAPHSEGEGACGEDRVGGAPFRRLLSFFHLGVSRNENWPQPGQSARMKGGTGTKREASSRLGCGNWRRGGCPTARASESGAKGTASPLERLLPQLAHPWGYLLTPRAAPSRLLDRTLQSLLASSPLSSGPWYAPGDRCLGIFNIWDAANAEVK